jgi:hypothetical protein
MWILREWFGALHAGLALMHQFGPVSCFGLVRQRLEWPLCTNLNQNS